MRKGRRTGLGVGLGIAMALVACSSEDGGASPTESALTGCPEAVAVTAQTAEASFARDVVPIFERSCTFGACHGTAGGTNHGVYLGIRGGGAGARSTDAVYESLVGRKSPVGPMPLVTASAPDKSWLMHKLEGSTCGFEKECAGGDCGERMPKGGEALAAAELAVIKAWIAQGAKKN